MPDRHCRTIIRPPSTVTGYVPACAFFKITPTVVPETERTVAISNASSTSTATRSWSTMPVESATLNDTNDPDVASTTDVDEVVSAPSRRYG